MARYGGDLGPYGPRAHKWARFGQWPEIGLKADRPNGLNMEEISERCSDQPSMCTC